MFLFLHSPRAFPIYIGKALPLSLQKEGRRHRKVAWGE